MGQAVRWRSPLGMALLTAWALAVVGPPLGLARWRAGRLQELAAPDVQANWDAFREDMRRAADGGGPVKRKVPKSPEPPELVWLRDFFPLAVGAWALFAGVLGGFLAFLTLGAFRPAATCRESAGR
ncbi:MAG: hypothetical protein RLZZ440_1617 [Planctomycetota bacterium]|jgi:hypothetical protein